MRVKGHALVWHGDSPAWLDGLAADDARQALRDHISTTVGRYRGRVMAWDVVNEALADDGSGLRDTVYLRWERVEKSGHELVLDPPDESRIFPIGGYTIGYVHDLSHGKGLDDQGEAMGEVIAGTAVEPHLRALLAGDDPNHRA